MKNPNDEFEQELKRIERAIADIDISIKETAARLKDLKASKEDLVDELRDLAAIGSLGYAAKHPLFNEKD